MLNHCRNELLKMNQVQLRKHFFKMRNSVIKPITVCVIMKSEACVKDQDIFEFEFKENMVC